MKSLCSLQMFRTLWGRRGSNFVWLKSKARTNEWKLYKSRPRFQFNLKKSFQHHAMHAQQRSRPFSELRNTSPKQGCCRRDFLFQFLSYLYKGSSLAWEWRREWPSRALLMHKRLSPVNLNLLGGLCLTDEVWFLYGLNPYLWRF